MQYLEHNRVHVTNDMSTWCKVLVMRYEDTRDGLSADSDGREDGEERRDCRDSGGLEMTIG